MCKFIILMIVMAFLYSYVAVIRHNMDLQEANNNLHNDVIYMTDKYEYVARKLQKTTEL